MSFKNNRKIYLYHLIAFLLGIGCIAAIWTSTKTFLSWAGFIIGAILIIGSLFNLAHVLEQQQIDKDPYYMDDLVRDLWYEKFLLYFSGIFLFIGFWALRVSHLWGDNLVHESRFYFICAIISTIIASLALLLLKKLIPAYFIKNESREKEILCLWLGSAMTTTALITLIVFSLPTHSSNTVDYDQIKWKKDRIRLVIEQGDQTLKFRPSKSNYSTIEKYNSIRIEYVKNSLGLEYAKYFTIIP